MEQTREKQLEQLRSYLRDGEAEQAELLFCQLQEACSLQNARLQALLDAVNEAVTIIDADDKVAGWNARAEVLYGISAAEILQQPIKRFFSNLLVSEVARTQTPVENKYHTPCPETHVLINARPVTVDGRLAGGVSAERDITELVQLNQQMQSLKKTLNEIHAQKDPFFAIHGRGEAIREAVSLARRVAPTGVPVLLRGESGTGKELFARAIHEASQVAGPYVPVNCGAIPANLFESELFGYQPGAFTGADRKGKAGLLEKANGGTVLLDEVGDLPREMQVKLLRTLQEKTLYRIGSSTPVPVDFRVIAATNRNLEERIRTGEFREDLYYRLNVVAIVLPPLRKRLDDIPELFQRRLQYYCALHNKSITRVQPSLMTALVQYPWPGNIREFLNVLERLVILAEGDTLGIRDLPKEFVQREPDEPDKRPPARRLPEATAGLERDVIARALKEAGNNKAAAAQILGIPRSTLYYKMQKLGLDCQ